jgi:hypothetical protein
MRKVMFLASWDSAQNAEPGHAQTLKEVENEVSTRAALADAI